MKPWYFSLPLTELQERFGRAAWIVSEPQLIGNLQRLSLFTGSSKRILYPVKANPAVPVLQVLAKANSGADCANMHEINQALLCGFVPENIVYNSPIQDWRTIQFVLDSGGTVVLDDPAMLNKLSADRYWEKLSGKMWLRINPSASVGYEHEDALQELMAHGSESSKFGIPEEDVLTVLENLRLPICGLHLHVGTQMDNLESFIAAMESLHRVADKLNASGCQIEHLDIGGGLGIAFSGAQQFPTIEEWTNALLPLQRDCYSYYAEPGHALVGDAVVLLMTVETIKASRGKRWAVCNVGTDQLAKITLLKWEHPVYCGDGIYLKHDGPDALAGPLCFAGDTLLHHTDVSLLSVNQPIVVTRAGAYLYSLSNTFNGRVALPWLVQSTEGSVLLSLRKEEMFNRLFLHQTDWQHAGSKNTEVLDIAMVGQLQSEYMSKQLVSDDYRFEIFERIGQMRYRVTTKVYCIAGFISMPLAMRIFGDASIVAVLHGSGASTKDHSVWGQKMTMDYFSQVSSNEPFIFFITLSHDYRYNGSQRIVVSFETETKGIQGMVVAHH